MKYLQSIYESKNSQYKQKYFKLINFYQNNPVKKYSLNECLQDLSLYSEYHHINPRWYYKSNHLPVDNSTSNIVLVPFKVHVELHICLAKHYHVIHDYINERKANRACIALCMDANFRYLNDQLSHDQIENLIQIKLNDNKRQSKLATQINLRDSNPWRNIPKDNIPKLYQHYIQYGFKGVEQFGYHMSEKHLIGYLRRNGYTVIKFGEKHGRAYTNESLIKMRDDFEQYGFEYMKKQNQYRGSKKSFIHLLDQHNIKNTISINKKHYKLKIKKQGVPQKKRISQEILQTMYLIYIKNGFKELQKQFKSCPKYEQNFIKTCKRRGII